MAEQRKELHPLVAHLEDLAKRDDRGALAALRRGLGQPPGTVAEMHPHVVPYIAGDRFGWPEQCCYIVAALFASHSKPGGRGNQGDTFRELSTAASGKATERSESVERRFVAMLKANREDLFNHLRHAVSLARSKEIAIDFHRLLTDIRNWDSDQRWVQRNWARSFWGSGGVTAPTETQGSITGE